MNELKKLYLGSNFVKVFYKTITKHPDYIFYKAVKLNKKYNYYKDKKRFINAFIYAFRVNRIATKYNLELYGKYGKNLRIWHSNIIINGNAVMGDNVQLHGNNCIGEKGEGKAPKIGNNVEIGVGANVIGDIFIADNIIIGANSLVNKSFYDEGVIIAGCPAHILKKFNES